MNTLGPNMHDTAVSYDLPYQAPYSWSGVLHFLRHRQIEGVEYVGEDVYARAVEVMHGAQRLNGWISVTHAPLRNALEVAVSVSLQPAIAEVLERTRRVFDTESQPGPIDAHLGALAAELPGMRVPGTFDGFEIVIRAVVGQQISVINARKVLGRIAGQFGTRVENAPFGLVHTLPGAAVIAELDALALILTGIIRIRAEAIVAAAQEVAALRIVLTPHAPLDDTLNALRDIRGIGEWTVQYIAMRALRWPNAFPEGDAVLKKHLGCTTALQLSERASQWAPWRAYAVVHLWRQHEEAKR
ncbi:AlkA N-terminal domain-containing protein [Pseudomonas sp. NA-150]|uniref:AlkA N-terminal domain-containing protein n=1 Tax=Pseudomonas sp. NA-150 TaxID=3367525 RepID=UPI0037C84C05